MFVENWLNERQEKGREEALMQADRLRTKR